MYQNLEPYFIPQAPKNHIKVVILRLKWYRYLKIVFFFFFLPSGLKVVGTTFASGARSRRLYFRPRQAKKSDPHHRSK